MNTRRRPSRSALRPPSREETAEADQVGADHPLQAPGRQFELVTDDRQGGDHDRTVEDHHEERRPQEPQGPPAAGVGGLQPLIRVTRVRTSCVRSGHRRSRSGNRPRVAFPGSVAERGDRDIAIRSGARVTRGITTHVMRGTARTVVIASLAASGSPSSNGPVMATMRVISGKKVAHVNQRHLVGRRGYSGPTGQREPTLETCHEAGAHGADHVWLGTLQPGRVFV